MSLESCVDVLVIGAGPAGLMSANALAMAGVDVRVIDQRPTKLTVGQADGIQSRTIEVWQSYGLAERLIREGNQVYMSAFYAPNERGEIECTKRERLVTPPTARFPFIVTLHQAAIESILLDSMSQRGVKVDRPVVPSVIEVSEDVEELASMSSYPVKVTLEHLDAVGDSIKTESVRAKFVIGADGAHSWVRRALGIPMEGEHTDSIWGVIDVKPDTDLPDIRKLTKIQSINGTCMIIPREDDIVRLYIQLSGGDIIDPSTGRVDKSRTSPEKLFEVARKMFQPFELRTSTDVNWLLVGQRIASRYSVRERVFIAGDACHTHSPKAGQGMNASMNDSHNLAWKLSQVLRGWASPSFLKTYELERRQFAQDLIAFDKEYSVLFTGKPRTVENQNGLSHENFFRASKKFGGFITGLDVQYAPSTLVNAKHQGCATNLVIGQRMLPQIFVRAADARPVQIQDMLPADIRFKVLVFTGILTDKQIANVNSLATQLSKPSSFLQKYAADGDVSSVFDIITIVAGRKEEANFLVVPLLFREHWSKVLLDDADVMRSRGGHGYESFGIDPAAITFVIVRPDGYVGMVAPSTAVDDVDRYFSSFLIPRGLCSS
ncbi:hypothetical protein PAXRUDRAFT_15250 [Paxillus rubicundulus Ve08.2h10]|uniref:Phenol 2-monooxygenase (NADPH) n=1 Tax=Paxillus rubicundulus Ve08.2h10 TaxID=930991 RepID=A0A0D0DIQ4_9AGAM|nr:hypothetical protein PAXRUDRAFT_15250 [Paxillus rubicundulus Ve08.2h10]